MRVIVENLETGTQREIAEGENLKITQHIGGIAEIKNGLDEIIALVPLDYKYIIRRNA